MSMYLVDYLKNNFDNIKRSVFYTLIYIAEF